MKELREVHGPSALGGGWRRAADLLLLMAVSEFRRAYFGTALGYVWTIARPLLLFGVLLLVFTQAFRLPAEIEHYPVLLLLGIVLFGFFQDATTTAVQSVVNAESIVRKTQFPRAVIPLATVVTASFNLGINLVVVAVFALALGVDPQPTWLLLPVLVGALFVLATAVAMLVSSLFPRFRDMALIWSVAVTALFYGTPVLYPLSVLDEPLRQVLVLNPLAPVFVLAHKWLIDPSAPSPQELAGGGERLLVPLLLALGLCVTAVVVFRREARRIAEAL